MRQASAGVGPSGAGRRRAERWHGYIFSYRLLFPLPAFLLRPIRAPLPLSPVRAGKARTARGPRLVASRVGEGRREESADGCRALLPRDAAGPLSRHVTFTPPFLRAPCWWGEGGGRAHKMEVIPAARGERGGPAGWGQGTASIYPSPEQRGDS